MKYQVYYKGSKVNLYNTDSVYSLNMLKDPKHRQKIEQYLASMNEPTLTDNGDGTVTLAFDPIPEEMATWIVDSKTVLFNIVRQHIGHRRSKTHRNADSSRKYNKSRHHIKNYFPYTWQYVRAWYPGSDDPCISNDTRARLIQNFTVNELKAGSITRNVSFLPYSYQNSWEKCRRTINFKYEHYIGFIYWNKDNIPTIYKMGKYDIII